MSDRDSTPSSPPTLADQGVGTTQVIDLADIDLSGALPEDLSGKLPESPRVAPPPLPPEELARASQAPPAMRPSQAPQAPQAEGRSTRFYVVVLAACLVAFVGAGALIARSMRSPSPPPGAVGAGGASAQPAPRVITISPVEMNDDVDGGAAK